jgi:hypothetical protein
MPGTIDTETGKIYWANWNSPRAIMFANVDGSGHGGTLYPIPGDAQTAIPIVLKHPTGTGVPGISGGGTTPSTLSCTPGSWAPDLVGELLYRAPASFSYAWTVNGAPVGSNSATIGAGSPGDYRCTVTASNFAGSSSQTSGAFRVSTPPPPPPPPPVIASTITNVWIPFKKDTKVSSLAVNDLPAGARVKEEEEEAGTEASEAHQHPGRRQAGQVPGLARR